MAKDFLQYRNHYVRDWETSETVRLMSYAARGIYQALLDAQWEKGSIPADPELCVRLLRCQPEEWAQFAPFFDECFPVMDCGSRRANERLVSDRGDALQLVEKNRAAGKASAEKRRLNPNPTDDEHPFNDRSTPVQRTFNPTTTTTTTTLLDDSKESSDTREDLKKSELIDPVAAQRSKEPFRSVALVMLEVTGGEPIPRHKIAKYLPENSAVRTMLAQHGLEPTRRLVRWVTEHKPKALKTIADNSETFMAEAKAANWGPPGKMARNPQGAQDERRRMLRQAVGLDD